MECLSRWFVLFIIKIQLPWKGISKDIGSDEENFEIKLNEIEIELRELDASKFHFLRLLYLILNFLDYVTIKRPDESIYGLNTTSDLIELAVERIKGPEVLFQPKIGGIDQSGVSEVISQVLKNYSPENSNYSWLGMV